MNVEVPANIFIHCLKQVGTFL